MLEREEFLEEPTRKFTLLSSSPISLLDSILTSLATQMRNHQSEVRQSWRPDVPLLQLACVKVLCRSPHRRILGEHFDRDQASKLELVIDCLFAVAGAFPPPMSCQHLRVSSRRSPPPQQHLRVRVSLLVLETFTSSTHKLKGLSSASPQFEISERPNSASNLFPPRPSSRLARTVLGWFFPQPTTVNPSFQCKPSTGLRI